MTASSSSLALPGELWPAWLVALIDLLTPRRRKMPVREVAEDSVLIPGF